MKKILLSAIFLSSTLAGFSQNAIKPKPSGKFNMAGKIALKFRNEPARLSAQAKVSAENPANVSDPVSGSGQLQNSVANPPSGISWKLLSGSSNVYGQLESRSRPLQYNPNVNVVSCIHRKSDIYSYTSSASRGHERCYSS
jgi:hypothetical protein